MAAIDFIFFDVDGTLIDARRDIVNAINYTLIKMGFPEQPFDNIVSYIGTGVKDLIVKSLGSRDKFLVEKGVEIYGDYYLKHPADEAVLFPHVKEVLTYFVNKRKLILTNRYARFADSALKALGIREYFEEIVGGDDESCLKPSSCVLDPVIEKLHIDKSRSLIVGDMAVDIQTGKNSGIKTCFVTYGLGKSEDVASENPDFVIDDLIELKNIIR